jgi:hypothetical protein
MRIIYRIPTEQYGYVEIEMEGDKIERSYEEIRGEVVALSKGEGSQDFNKVIDKYLATKTLTADEYESLNSEEKNIIQVIKRSFKRQHND